MGRPRDQHFTVHQTTSNDARHRGVGYFFGGDHCGTRKIRSSSPRFQTDGSMEDEGAPCFVPRLSMPSGPTLQRIPWPAGTLIGSVLYVWEINSPAETR